MKHWIFRYTSAALLGSLWLVSGTLRAQSNNITVIRELGSDFVPPKPENLKRIPMAKLEFVCDPTNAPILRSFFVQFFQKAQRPNLTQGDEFDFIIESNIITPPDIVRTESGSGMSGKKIIGGLKTWLKVPDIAENFTIDKTNIVAEAHCQIQMMLMNKKKDILAQESVEVVRTNNLGALGVELMGVALQDSARKASDFTKVLSKTAMQQAVLKVAAYHVGTNFLNVADQRFFEWAEKHPEGANDQHPKGEEKDKAAHAGTDNKEKSKEEKEKPKEDAAWYTPQEFADKLKVSVEEVVSSLEAGQIKGKKIGTKWRIPASELQ